MRARLTVLGFEEKEWDDVKYTYSNCFISCVAPFTFTQPSSLKVQTERVSRQLMVERSLDIFQTMYVSWMYC